MKADDRPAVTFEPFDGFTKTQNHRKIESFCSYSELKEKLLKSYNLRPNIASRLTVRGREEGGGREGGREGGRDRERANLQDLT